MNDRALVTIGEASSILGVSEASLRQWTDEGRVKAFVTPGGHRRYSKVELKRFMGSHPKMLGVKGLVVELEATSELHREIGRSSLTTKDWYSKLDAECWMRLSSLGRSMLDIIARYIAEPSERQNILKLAREVGRGFGETLAGLGLPLTDSVEAFILHRDPLMNVTTHIMRKREAPSWRVVEAIPLVGLVMDEALLSLVAAHQQYGSSPGVKEEDSPR